MSQIVEVDLREEIGAHDFSFADTEKSIEDFINENSRFSEKFRKHFQSKNIAVQFLWQNTKKKFSHDKIIKMMNFSMVIVNNIALAISKEEDEEAERFLPKRINEILTGKRLKSL